MPPPLTGCLLYTSVNSEEQKNTITNQITENRSVFAITNGGVFAENTTFEEGLALQLQAQVGEPGRQQQRDGDLRDEANDPEQQLSVSYTHLDVYKRQHLA